MSGAARSLLPPDGGRVVVNGTQRPDGIRPVICSMATGRHRELLAESAPTLAAYAERHGWSVVLTSEDLEPARPASWSKVKLIRELLPEYDFVFWIDADAIIVDLERDLLAEVTEDADAWFARHPQAYDAGAAVLNAGVFLVRSTPFAEDLLGAVWSAEEFIDHNWWENAALLDLLGYSLDAPYPKVRESEWQRRIGELDLAWNSVPGYCESAHPAINHHARSDHDDFGRRLAAMAADRAATLPGSAPATVAATSQARRRDHEFTGVPLGQEPTTEEMLALIDRLDADNELQRLRIIELLDLLETAVTDQVAAERRADEAAALVRAAEADAEQSALRLAAVGAELARVSAELDALRATKLLRAAAPLRRVYALVRRRR